MFFVPEREKSPKMWVVGYRYLIILTTYLSADITKFPCFSYQSPLPIRATMEGENCHCQWEKTPPKPQLWGTSLFHPQPAHFSCSSVMSPSVSVSFPWSGTDGHTHTHSQIYIFILMPSYLIKVNGLILHLEQSKTLTGSHCPIG